MFDFYDNLYENHFFLNNGSGYFKIGDIDSDDDIDVIFYCNPFFFWGYIINSGLGQYSNPVYYNLEYPPTDIDVGDLNADGRDDIVISGQEVEIYFSYESGFDCYQLGYQELSVRITDVDSDGDNDVIGLASALGATMITIYENFGNSNFYEHDPFYFQSDTGYLQVSDLNNDSLPDLICSGCYNDGIYIFYNNGDFDFSEPQFFYTGEDTRKVHCDDLDNNNYNDIIALTHYTVAPDYGKLHILFNDGTGNFVEEPQVGTNEECIIDNNQCKLTNYPNPFNPTTTISFSLQTESKVSIAIYNVKGQQVKHLINEKRTAGLHTIEWNGKDNNNKSVSSGIYYYKISSGKDSAINKMLLLK